MSDTEAVVWIGLATFAATLLGPIFAVEVSKRRDAQRERKNRQVDVFRALMRNRRSALSPEFVGALNLIEVEFFDAPTVISACKKLLEHFSSPQISDRNAQHLWLETSRRLQSEMLVDMAKYLNMHIPALTIAVGGYSPIAHEELEIDQIAIRKLFVQIASGERAVPVQLVDRPFPPQPEQGERTSK